MKNGKWDEVNKQVSASIYLIWRFFKSQRNESYKRWGYMSHCPIAGFAIKYPRHGHNGIILRTGEYVKLLRNRSI